MSGQYCPDCQIGRLERAGDGLRCLDCGWEGEVQPNIAYTPETLARIEEKSRRRADGRLHFLKISLDASARDSVMDVIFDQLQEARCSERAGGFHVECSVPPSEAVLARLRSLPGVSRVEAR